MITVRHTLMPQGVPSEFKVVNQAAADFESILHQIAINKNVERISYIHFNVQRLNNLTRDALQSVHKQLAATSLMRTE